MARAIEQLGAAGRQQFQRVSLLGNSHSPGPKPSVPYLGDRGYASFTKLPTRLVFSETRIRLIVSLCVRTAILHPPPTPRKLGTRQGL